MSHSPAVDSPGFSPHREIDPNNLDTGNGPPVKSKPSGFKFGSSLSGNTDAQASQGTSNHAIPPQEHPRKPDFWNPPTGDKQGKFRFDAESKSYVLVAKRTNGVETPLTQAEFAQLKNENSNGTQTRPKIGSGSIDYVDNLTEDGPIWRKPSDAEGGNPRQIGFVQDGKRHYFTDDKTFTAVNQFNDQEPKLVPPEPPAKNDLNKTASGRPVAQVSGEPPEIPSTVEGQEDIRVPISADKDALMRWEPNVGRHVVIGTVDKGMTTDQATIFKGDQVGKYHDINNGPEAAFPRGDKGKPQYMTELSEGRVVVKAYDKVNEEWVTVGWKNPGETEIQKFPKHKGSFAGISAVQRLSEQEGVATTNKDQVLTVKDGTPPGDLVSTAKHPTIVRRAQNNFDDPHAMFTWSWDPKLDRYVATHKESSAFSDDEFKKFNGGDKALKLTADGSPPTDVAKIPLEESHDGNHPDKERYYELPHMNGWKGSSAYIYERWSDDYGKYVQWAWEPLVGGDGPRAFSEAEFKERNGL